MNTNKDIQSLRKALKDTGIHYEGFLSESSDATALNQEFEGYADMVVDLINEDMDFQDVLCVSDVLSESPHASFFKNRGYI